MRRPQIIVANKMDACQGEQADIVEKIKDAFKEEGYPVYGISAVTGEGVRELLFAIYEARKAFPDDITIYDSEVDPDLVEAIDPVIKVYKGDDGIFYIEGQRIDKMLGYTNLESEKGFLFFQKFIKENGIQTKLDRLGIEDGDTVDVGGWLFEYYK